MTGDIKAALAILKRAMAVEQEIVDMIINEEKKHLSELPYMANKLRRGV